MLPPCYAVQLGSQTAQSERTASRIRPRNAGSCIPQNSKTRPQALQTTKKSAQKSMTRNLSKCTHLRHTHLYTSRHRRELIPFKIPFQLTVVESYCKPYHPRNAVKRIIPAGWCKPNCDSPQADTMLHNQHLCNTRTQHQCTELLQNNGRDHPKIQTNDNTERG